MRMAGHPECDKSAQDSPSCQPLAVAGAAAKRTSRLRHAIIAQLLAVLLLGAVVAWQPERTVLAGGGGAGEEFVRVIVPDKSHPGDMLQVAVAGHRQREIEVPQGAQAGQTLIFAVPAGAPPSASSPRTAHPASKAAAVHTDQEREVVDATRRAYRAALAKASGGDAAGSAALAAEPEAEASSSETANGDDFGPLIAAIKEIIKSASSNDPAAKAQSQDALKAAVNGIVAEKIKAARAEDAAKAAAEKSANKNATADFERQLDEEKTAEEAKVKEAQDAQKAAEEAKAKAEAEAIQAEEQIKELEKENEAKQEKEAAPKAAILEQKEVDTASTDRGTGSTHFLDRQDVDCKEYPMSGFKMQTTYSGEMTKISYRIKCAMGANLDVSEVIFSSICFSAICCFSVPNLAGVSHIGLVAQDLRMCVPDRRTTQLLWKMTAVEVSSTWIDWTWIAAAMLPFPNSNSYAMETARRRIRFVFPNPANEPSLQLPEPASHYDWYWDATHLSHGFQQLRFARICSIRPRLGLSSDNVCNLATEPLFIQMLKLQSRSIHD